MPLLNVRLDAEDARMAAALRDAGVPISGLVREALHAEYDRRIGHAKPRRKRSRIVADILAALPDPPGLPPPVDTSDRGAVRRHVQARLARKRA